MLLHQSARFTRHYSTIIYIGIFMLSHLSLEKIATLSQSVSLQQDQNDIKFIIIDHPLFQAAFSLHGAHLLHFQNEGEPALIWLSDTALYNGKKAIRGGVPICWPWFGPAGAHLGDDLPAHGFARNQPWKMSELQETEQGVEIEFTLTDSAETRVMWPYPFELRLKASLKQQLKLELISTNKGKEAFNYRGALHSYLNISHPAAAMITGLQQQFSNSLQQGELQHGDGTLQVDQAIDAIYKKADAAIHLNDTHLQRNISILNSGNDSEVLWTPWIKGAKAFDDMPDDGYQTMFCIESAITKEPGKSILPGESHCLSTLLHTF